MPQSKVFGNKKIVKKTKIQMIKERLRAPVPVLWGVLTLLLFAGFTVVTQLQFNRVNEKHLYRARYDVYLSAVQEYDSVVQARSICLSHIEDAVIDKQLFEYISSLFKRNDEAIQKIYKTISESGYTPTKFDDVIAKAFDSMTINKCPEIPKSLPVAPEG